MEQAVALHMKHMNPHQTIKHLRFAFIHLFFFFPKILSLFLFCESQIKATNNRKIPKQTVGKLTCETVFACLFWRGSHSPALTFIYPHRMYSYTFSSRVPCFLWVFSQLPIQTARVWNRLFTILKMLFSHWVKWFHTKIWQMFSIRNQNSIFAPHSTFFSSRYLSFPLYRIWSNFPLLLLFMWTQELVNYTRTFEFPCNLFWEVKGLGSLMSHVSFFPS